MAGRTLHQLSGTAAQGQRSAGWRGRSGRVHQLQPCRFDAFRLEPGIVHLIARGNLVLWAGSPSEVVDDAQSRARFRLALDCADRAFSAGEARDALERMTLIWDLEGAEPIQDVALAPSASAAA
jgi:hypothetical protein